MTGRAPIHREARRSVYGFPCVGFTKQSSPRAIVNQLYHQQGMSRRWIRRFSIIERDAQCAG